MNLEERIKVFVKLGICISESFLAKNSDKINQSISENPWFTKKNIENALFALKDMLELDMLQSWIKPYSMHEQVNPKRVLIIMAGNIPFVGFHDLLSVIISGHKPIVKLSSNDRILMSLLIEVLITISPSLKNDIQFIDKVKNKKFDAVISTGTDNSAHYFKYYFRDAKKIIRKNRRSIAILDGSETSLELKGLASDVFAYFGLGCRNVSKIYLPNGYDLNLLFEAFFEYNKIVDHRKYGNNYDYNKAVFLMGNNRLIENGFILLKEDESLHSPVAMLYYEFYNDKQLVDHFISKNKESIQCVVSKDDISFGMTQNPRLWDYADGIDTIDFLRNI